MAEEKSLKLRVQDSDPAHVGRNIVTLDRQSKKALDVTSGDIVEINGPSKTTAAVIWPARSEDEGKGIIRMDSFIRHNVGVGLGDSVTLKKADFKEAKEVVMAPAQEVRIIASGYNRILKKSFLGRPLVQGDNVWISVFGSGFVYKVVNTKPRGIVKITDFTNFKLKEKPVKGTPEGVPSVAYEDIGGLKEQLQKVREMVELPMRHPEVFRKLGIIPPKGILLFGPPGTGKTLMAKAVANETNAHFISLNAPEVMCVEGDTEIVLNPGGRERIDSLFDQALQDGSVVNDGRFKTVELSKPVDIFCLNNRLKIEKGKATHVTKLKAETLTIETSFGDELVVSFNQPFAVMDSSGNLQWKKASELKKGELIAAAAKLPNGKKKGDDFRVPNISQLLRKIKTEKGLIYGRSLPEEPVERYLSERDPLTKRKLVEINKLLGGKNETLNKIIDSDLNWVKITEIKKGKEKELFDLTVEPFNNFLAGSTPIILHNSKFVGEAEQRLRQVFKEAEENAPTIIFIDEIDSIAPKRDEVIGEVERRVVAQLLALMDGLEARGDVIVMAATNRVNSLDEALRRPGRFDREIEFAIPDRNERKEILQIHTRGMPLSDNVKLGNFASLTHGFVGADLEALCKESAMKALRRYLPEIDLEEDEIPQEVLEKLEINKNDFKEGLKDVQPSALREVAVQIPKVNWNDVGGLEQAKGELKQAVEWPLKSPKSFKEMGIKAPKGILLYGPPGCGKTLIAKAVANESDANFISVKGPELLSMWVGESERAVRKIFRKARQAAPAIVFFDELDSIAGIRTQSRDSGVGNRVLDQILTELDGLEVLENVVFMAATNRPDLVDKALLRPGRIDKLISIKSPDKETREKIFKVHTREVPLAKDVSLKKLAEKTSGYSGADIEGLVREAAMIALRENNMKKSDITLEHFEKALEKANPSISERTEKTYEEFKEHLTDFKPSYVG